jgi:hypothetical protein
MGPVRGRLIAAFALPTVLIASPAAAQVCATLRPLWEAGAGPVGVLGEMAHVFGSIPGMTLLTLFALAMWRGWRPLLGLVSLAALGLATLLYIGAFSELRAQAVVEGCAGPVLPAAAVLAGMAVAAFVRFWRKLGAPRGL